MDDEPMKRNERNLLGLRDGLIVAGILLAAVVWALIPGLTGGSGARDAVIACGNREIARLSLLDDGEYTFPETGEMVFAVREGAIQVTFSDCGDGTCVRTGAISSPGEAIVCVPNRVSVTVEGGSPNDLDVVLK